MVWNGFCYGMDDGLKWMLVWYGMVWHGMAWHGMDDGMETTMVFNG